MARVWTKDQTEAIYSKWCNEEKTKRSNILVQAAAGSGKTAVLVERIIRKLIPDDGEDATDINRLLVVTFTNAAAGEMQERITEALSKELTESIKSGDFKKQKYLKKQLSLVPTADITTIDSFCLKTVRSYFHLLDIDPEFSIMDSSELELLKDDAIEKLFEELYEENDKDFLDLLCRYTDGRDDAKVAEKIKEIYNFIGSFPEPEEWLLEKRDNFKSAEFWKREGIKKARGYVEKALESLGNAARIITGSDDFENIMLNNQPGEANELSENWGVYYTAIYNEYFNAKSMLDSNWNKIFNGADVEYVRLTSKALPVDKDLKEQVKFYRDEAKKAIASVKNHISMSEENLKKLIEEDLYKIVSEFARLTLRFSEIYMGLKSEQNVLEFSDVEHLCYRLFKENETVREEYKNRFDEILMDEYQDSNRLQDQLFRIISRGDNIFMVGDMKQSIYRFRSSDPTIFKEKSDLYKKGVCSENRKIILGKNFRSRKMVLESINRVFEFIMSQSAGGLDYDEDQCLNVGDDTYEDKNPDYRSECIVIEEKSEEGVRDIDKVRLEARVIAKRIKELKDSGFLVRDRENVEFIDPKTGETKTEIRTVYRNIRNKDITILMSSYKSVANVYIDEMTKMGIECYADSVGYFDRNEIKLVTALLKVISNPYQDIPLLGVMRSPIGGFSDDDLVNIRLAGDGYIYTAMKTLIKDYEEGENDISETAEKVKHFLEDIKRWRGYSEYMSSDKLLWTLYEETDIYSFVGALYGGEEAQANLRLLFERAKKYESSGFKGLFNFVRYISLLKKKNAELSTASAVTQNHDVVRVMTIHKSKGLEFPVVFLARAGTEFSLRDTMGDMLIHRDMGFGLDYIDFEKSARVLNITKSLISEKIHSESISEEIRKLYVAMTRAKEKLIVTSVIRGTKLGYQPIYDGWSDTKIMTAQEVLSKKKFIDWIAPVSINNPAEWDFKTVSYMEGISEEIELKTEEEEANDTARDISRYMEYQYPYNDAKDVPTKVSVSEIKRKKGSADILTAMIPAPDFMRDKKDIKGAARGTVIHYIMQTIPLSSEIDGDYIKKFVDELVLKGEISEEEKNSVDIGAISRFYESPLGKRMLACEKVSREAPFETEIPAKMVSEEYPDDESVILQGVIDCYFEEEDGLVIVDYKSDYYNNIEEIKEKYTTQVELYSSAIEKITEKKVKNKFLYLFFKNDVVEL